MSSKSTRCLREAQRVREACVRSRPRVSVFIKLEMSK